MQRPLVSPDGKWWWDGQRWNPTRQTGVSGPIQIQRKVRLRYSRDVEPEEVRARFGSILTAVGFLLTLPAMAVGTIFSMAIAVDGAPLWTSIGEGLAIMAGVLGVLGGAPLAGLCLGFGLRDGLRWVLLCLLLSGLIPAIFIGGLTAIASGNTFNQFAEVMIVLGWMWAIPALGLVLLRASHIGRPLPHLAAFAGMFGNGWRHRLPGEKTEWGEILVAPTRGGYQLRVPDADFWLPNELAGVTGPVRVTYDLRAGTLETVEVPQPGDSSEPR